MAKHIKGKFVSKGSRKSCNPLKKTNERAAIMPMHVSNAMREAFMNTPVLSAVAGSPLVKSVINSLARNAGTQRIGRGWTANVSKRTEDALRKQGVFA